MAEGSRGLWAPTELAWWLRALDTVRVAVESAYERLEFLPAPPGALVVQRPLVRVLGALPAGLVGERVRR